MQDYIVVVIMLELLGDSKIKNTRRIKNDRIKKS